MTSITAKKIVYHAMELAFGFAPSQKNIYLSYFSDDNGGIDIDFSIFDVSYGLIYCDGAYLLRRKDFYGYGHDLIVNFYNE